MKWWRFLKTFPILIFLVALIFRLLPVLSMPNMGIGLDDMFQYDMIARSLASGNGYRWYSQQDLPLVLPYIHLDLTSVNYDPRGVQTTFRPPLYPAFLALIYLITGVSAKRFLIVRLVQAVMGAALAPLTYSIARRLFPDRLKIATIAACIVAVYPMLILYPLALATENLFFLLFLTSTWFLLKASEEIRNGKPKRLIYLFLAGLCLGLTALTRSVSLLLAGLSILWIWFWLKERKMAVITAVTVSLVVLPWVVRNTIVDHRLTGIESALGYDLYVGYHPAGSGTFQYPQSLELMSMLDDGQRDAIGRDKAIEFIKADPGRFFYLVERRAGYFFGLEQRELTYFYSNNFFGHISKGLLIGAGLILILPFMLVSTSAAVGAAAVPWNRDSWLLALLFLGYVTPHLFIIAEERFHMTMVPLLSILAVFAWSAGPQVLRERWRTKKGRAAICLACLAVLLLLFNWGTELWRDADKITQLIGPYGNQSYFSY